MYASSLLQVSVSDLTNNTQNVIVSRTSASKIFIRFLIKYIAIILLLSTCISVLSDIEVANLQ